ncbi:protein lifeguard 1-like [Cheilinus undulatus]|uniref:protein lifeguard 1-like n=1 Tax=Cheilinus undulatus TaxID=241271 RepID=UPI001BD457AE|nr:protein lifeguard 1-like [Cheilinus undulatus]
MDFCSTVASQQEGSWFKSRYQEKKTPPNSADPATDPPPKDKATDTQSTENESSSDISPEATSDSTQLTEPSSFEDKNVRRGFVRKVFCIVILMFLFTFAVVCLFTFCKRLKDAVQENLWVYLSSYIIFTTVITSFAAFKSFSRRHPWNIVGLVLVTLSLSYMAGTIASFHDTTSVLIAMGSTIIIFAVIIAFSAQDRVKFNTCYVILLIIAVDVIMFGIMYGIFKSFHPSHIPHILLGSFGAFLLSMCLLIDVQLMTGKMKDRVDPEEYVFAALLIYLDIVIIFIWFLQIMGQYS